MSYFLPAANLGYAEFTVKSFKNHSKPLIFQIGIDRFLCFFRKRKKQLPCPLVKNFSWNSFSQTEFLDVCLACLSFIDNAQFLLLREVIRKIKITIAAVIALQLLEINP